MQEVLLTMFNYFLSTNPTMNEVYEFAFFIVCIQLFGFMVIEFFPASLGSGKGPKSERRAKMVIANKQKSNKHNQSESENTKIKLTIEYTKNDNKRSK